MSNDLYIFIHSLLAKNQIFAAVPLNFLDQLGLPLIVKLCSIYICDSQPKLSPLYIHIYIYHINQHMCQVKKLDCIAILGDGHQSITMDSWNPTDSPFGTADSMTTSRSNPWNVTIAHISHLLGGLEAWNFYDFPLSWEFYRSQLIHIFQRGRGIPPTRHCWWYMSP